MASFSRRLALLALPVLAVVACGAANGDGAKAPTEPAAAGTPSAGYDLGYIKGSADAPVTLIEYASPTCPTCKFFHDSILPEIEEKYVATGKVKFIYREFPIHGAVDVAAYSIARCAGPDKYFDVIDDLFEHQEGIVQAAQAGALTTMLKTVGKRHGIETDEAFDACLKNRDIRNEMAAVYETVQEYGLDGTPSFIIDGKVRNWGGDYTSVAGFSKQLDAVLAEKGAQ